MELNHNFTVAVSEEEAWALLTDVERIAPLMPGAQLLEADGDDYKVLVKVKVGPITAQYQGVATMTEADEAVGRIVIDAKGRDTKGQGNASALVTVGMTGAGPSTDVSVHTDLTISGKVAQMGRGVVTEVSSKLLDQFVKNLETHLAQSTAESSDDQAPAEPGRTKPEPEGVRVFDAPPAEALDLWAAARWTMLKRASPGVVLLLVALAGFVLRRRRG